MKINQMKAVQVEAKTLSLHMKVCDQFRAQLLDAEGALIKDYEGYVPGFMPGAHSGDYLILDIEVETGKITNWLVPTVAELEEFASDTEE